MRTNAISMAAFCGLVLSFWMIICLITSAYLTFPHLELLFAAEGASFFEWLTIVTSVVSSDIVSNPIKFIVLFIVAITLTTIISTFLAYTFNREMAIKASESFAWAVKSLYKKSIVLFVFVMFSFIALLFESLIYYLNTAVILVMLLLPFILLQTKLVSSEDNPNIITWPSWPGWSAFYVFLMLALVGLALDFGSGVLLRFDSVPSYLIHGIQVFLSIGIIMFVQVWVVITRSGVKSILINRKHLFSKRIFFGWIFVVIIYFFFLAFILVPVACIGVLDTFFYPALLNWSASSSSEIGYSWQLLHTISDKGSQLIFMLSLPLEAVFWLSAGRYVWLSLIKTDANFIEA